jgi:hypothetical protein
MTREDSRPAKPERRWYQFSLRTLLVFVAVVGVGLGWLGGKVRRIRNEQNAVAEIQSIGGKVYYGFLGSVGGGPWPLAEVAVTRRLFATILDRIERLALPPSVVNGQMLA